MIATGCGVKICLVAVVVCGYVVVVEIAVVRERFELLVASIRSLYLSSKNYVIISNRFVKCKNS